MLYDSLTLLGFNLIYSQWAQIFPSKHVIIFAVFIFELGSLVSAVAPSMTVLILGRAICGVGGAGIFSGGMLIIVCLVPRLGVGWHGEVGRLNCTG